jgi:hypothetical protein
VRDDERRAATRWRQKVCGRVELGAGGGAKLDRCMLHHARTPMMTSAAARRATLLAYMTVYPKRHTH